MGFAARNHNHDDDCAPCAKHGNGHSHGGSGGHDRGHGNDCDEHDCECDCDNVISDELIDHDHHVGHCVTVCGDYSADEHDEVIIVFGNGNNVDAAGAQLPSEVELPCPDDLDPCFPITVIAVDAPVIVSGLRNEDRVDANGLTGTGQVQVPLGGQATFRAIPATDKCDCAFYLACVCHPA